MGIKVNVGLAKKIGQPDYGSLGATCNVEFELDGGFDNGSSEIFTMRCGEPTVLAGRRSKAK